MVGLKGDLKLSCSIPGCSGTPHVLGSPPTTPGAAAHAGGAGSTQLLSRGAFLHLEQKGRRGVMSGWGGGGGALLCAHHQKTARKGISFTSKGKGHVCRGVCAGSRAWCAALYLSVHLLCSELSTEPSLRRAGGSAEPCRSQTCRGRRARCCRGSACRLDRAGHAQL